MATSNSVVIYLIRVTSKGYIVMTNYNSSGGSGLHIEFTICTPGLNCCKNHEGNNSNSKYNIQYCSFVNNSAHWLDSNPRPILPSYQVLIPRLGQGGGLYISIGADATDNIFILKFCKFWNNSASYNAGGMIAGFLNSATNNSVYIFQTDFEGNKCMTTQYSSAGGLSAICFTMKPTLMGNSHRIIH